MKVRVLTAKDGFKAGTIVDMDAAEARRWLSSGDGEKADAKAGTVAATTAAADPGTQDDVEKR